MATLKTIRDDLSQTRMDSPFPGLTTHAYLWRRPAGNVLFYNPVGQADFGAIAELGGVSAQYLSHLDEAGPNLTRIAERFGRRLHAPAAELEAIGKHGRIDVALTRSGTSTAMTWKCFPRQVIRRVVRATW